MTAHVDEIQYHAAAFREMEPVDRQIVRENLRSKYDYCIRQRDELDDMIEEGEAEIAATQRRINEMALDRAEAQRGAVRSSALLSCLEAQEGR